MSDLVELNRTLIKVNVELRDDNEALRNKLAVLEANPQVGTCCICGSAIWHMEARMTDERGTFHPICAIKAERDGLREALEQVEQNCATEFYQCRSCGEATSTADCNSHYVVREALAKYRALDAAKE